MIAETDDGTREGVRNRAMIRLMRAAGLRIGETCALPNDAIQVTGGGGAIVLVPQDADCRTGARRVPFSMDPNLATALRDWLAVAPVSPYLFGTYAGTAVHPNSFSRALKRYAERAGIEKRIHPSVLRSTAAADSLTSRDGVPVQVAVGHRDIIIVPGYDSV